MGNSLLFGFHGRSGRPLPKQLRARWRSGFWVRVLGLAITAGLLTSPPVPWKGVLDGVPSSRDYEGGFGSALMLKVPPPPLDHTDDLRFLVAGTRSRALSFGAQLTAPLPLCFPPGASGCGVKDLGLAISAAEQCSSPVPVGSLVQELYRVVCEDGHGGQDFSSLFRHVYGEGLRGPKACRHPPP